jgi:hypothetical protein
MEPGQSPGRAHLQQPELHRAAVRVLPGRGGAPGHIPHPDPAVAADADAFLRQEALHARAHRHHVTALTEQYPGLAEVSAEIERRFDRRPNPHPSPTNGWPSPTAESC